MSRWNIEKIILYSHDGRRRDVTFVPGAVNIITGRSNRGKSALTEIIDYALGADECHLPPRVRDASSWVGVLWINDKTRCFICRRVPDARHKTSEDAYVETGGAIAIPASAAQLVPNANTDGALRRFEQLLGMGEISTEPVASRSSVRISVRHTMPYVLQDDDVIISKIMLLRGSNDERHRQIIDTLPYILGVVDESTAEKRARLRGLRGQLSAREREASVENRIRGEASNRAYLLALEAARVGIAPAPVEGAHLRDLLLLLRMALEWVPEQPSTGGDEQLLALYESERQTAGRASRLRQQAREARRLMDAASGFSETVNAQVRRLEVVRLIPEAEVASVCPLCAHPIGDTCSSLHVVRDAMSRLADELGSTARERPRLDAYVQEREEQLREEEDHLAGIRSQIAGLVRQSEAAQRELTLADQRHRTVGRISLFLEAADPDADAPRMVSRDLEALRSEVEQLDQEVNSAAITEAMADVRREVSAIATSIATRLPWGEAYRDRPIDFNPRDLSASIRTRDRRIKMRDIGGDQNYLSLHLAILFALQQYFGECSRPVPGVLLFDQPSRPFYDPDVEHEEVVISADEAVISAEEEEERTQLKRYFDFLFDEVRRQSGIQVIVLEHAFFKDDARFVDATHERWNREKGLVPNDWSAESGGQQVMGFQ